MTSATNKILVEMIGPVQTGPCATALDIMLTVTVTKLFIMRFLLKDRKCRTKSFTYVQRSPD